MSLKLTNTHISNDSTRKCLVYVDKNGHYHLKQYQLEYWVSGFSEACGWKNVQVGRTKFKHIESANRAVAKWIKK